MKPKPRSNVDPIEREIERALQPGAFIRDGQCFSFVNGLEEIATTVDKLITTDPARAVELHETFLAGCHAKADELDDSSGSFGQFARDLICGWIKARQSSGANPDMTASTLLGWMDDDPCAFCYEIEEDAVSAFNKEGLAAFEKEIRARFEAAAKDPSSWDYRNASGILRAIYCAQRDVQAYVTLAEQTGVKPEDCLAVAKLIAAQNPDEALAWAERAIPDARRRRAFEFRTRQGLLSEGRAGCRVGKDSAAGLSGSFPQEWIHQRLSNVGRRREACRAEFLSGARQGALGERHGGSDQ
jgi:hypothetical protein